MDVPEWLLAELLPTKLVPYRRTEDLPAYQEFEVVRAGDDQVGRHASRMGTRSALCGQLVRERFPVATLWVVDCVTCASEMPEGLTTLAG